MKKYKQTNQLHANALVNHFSVIEKIKVKWKKTMKMSRTWQVATIASSAIQVKQIWKLCITTYYIKYLFCLPTHLISCILLVSMSIN